MKHILTSFLFLLSTQVLAAPSFYLITEFSGELRSIYLYQVLYCGEEGDFAAEDYCYPVILPKTSFLRTHDDRVVANGRSGVTIGKLTGETLDLNLGPDGSGTLGKIEITSSLSVEKKSVRVRNRGSNGEPAWPLFIKITQLNFMMTVDGEIKDQVTIQKGFYRRY